MQKGLIGSLMNYGLTLTDADLASITVHAVRVITTILSLPFVKVKDLEDTFAISERALNTFEQSTLEVQVSTCFIAVVVGLAKFIYLPPFNRFDIHS